MEGAHEKGGVEGEIGRFRRRHLVPVPEVESVAELNVLLARAGHLDDARYLPGRACSIGAEFVLERAALRPLPASVFEAGITLFPRVDRHSRITVHCHQYSVPARLVGRQVRMLLRAHELIVYAAAPGAAGSSARLEVARHERSPRKHAMTLVLDHYLEVLARKPGALPGATALAQARRSGTFTSAHEAFWAAARRALGDADGTRELVEVLLLHRHLPAQHIVAGLVAATGVGAVRAHVVAVEARRIAQGTTETISPASAAVLLEAPSVADLSERVVARLTERRLADPQAVITGLPPGQPAVAHRRALRRAAHPHPQAHHGGRVSAGDLHQQGTGVTTTPTASSSTTTFSPTSIRRRRGLSEEAAVTAVGQACRALRLPSIRAKADDLIGAAEREQLSYRGFLGRVRQACRVLDARVVGEFWPVMPRSTVRLRDRAADACSRGSSGCSRR